MPAKRAYHHGNLRAALVAAALKELAANGLEKFSLRNVARRAKVSAPAVYRHFADKDALVVAVALECAERMNAAMAAAIGAAPSDPLEGFREVGIAIVRFAVVNPEHYRVISLPGLTAHAPPEHRAQEQAWYEAQKHALAEAQRRGLIADVPLDDLMLTADAAINGLARTIIDGKLGPLDDARAEQLAIAVTRVLGYGFMPRETPPSDPRA